MEYGEKSSDQENFKTESLTLLKKQKNKKKERKENTF